MKNKVQSELAAIKVKAQDVAKNTASAVEFIAETVKAESRHFKNLAVSRVTARLTGYAHKPQRDVSLEPLAGVSHRE